MLIDQTTRTRSWLSLKVITLPIIFLFLYSCSPYAVRPTSAERLILENGMKNKGPEYSQPRLVSGKLILTLSNVETFTDSTLTLDQNNPNIPGDEKPYLGIWSADIRDYPTQQVLPGSMVSPDSYTLFEDSDYGNIIHHWNVLDQIGELDSFKISRTFRYLTYDYRPVPTPDQERQQWATIPDSILQKYTRPERFLEQDEALIDTVFMLLENVADPVSQARVLYDFVQSTLTYVYPPEERGVRNAFKTRAGDCGQYSALFISMARIAGIPARQQSGFNFYSGRTGAHVWSEIYLPIKGWVPVDATREDGFLHLDNRRLITSIGLNIPLEQSPEWATFSNSEVDSGRTDFMQMYTLVKRGVKANFSSQRIIVRSVEL